jgi:hypothetical protein
MYSDLAVVVPSQEVQIFEQLENRAAASTEKLLVEAGKSCTAGYVDLQGKRQECKFVGKRRN